MFRSLSGHLRQRITSTLLQRPAGVAVSPWTGEIYVAATDSHRVYVMDKTGKIVKSLGSPYRSNDRLGGGTADTVTNVSVNAITSVSFFFYYLFIFRIDIPHFVVCRRSLSLLITFFFFSFRSGVT